MVLVRTATTISSFSSDLTACKNHMRVDNPVIRTTAVIASDIKRLD
jgi:hypothetical protein